MVPSMVFYPIFLDLRDKPVVVVGGGKVAVRKAKGLLEAGAKVTLISPDLVEDLPVFWKKRRYRKGDLRGAVLAFAATDQRGVNGRVAEEGKSLGVFVNIADALEECDFIVPARVCRGSLQVAVSTGGESPGLARDLRKQLESLLSDVRS